MLQTWNETLITAQIDGTALTNTLTPTSLLPSAAVFLLPANMLAIGKKFRVRAGGRISTLVTAPGTLTLDLRFGSTIVFSGGAMALNVVAKTNVSWRFEADLVCRSIGGSTATMLGMGKFQSEAVIGSPLPTVGGSGILLLPASAPAPSSSFDSTASQAVNMYGTWSIANAANSIQLHQYSLESLN